MEGYSNLAITGYAIIKRRIYVFTDEKFLSLVKKPRLAEHRDGHSATCHSVSTEKGSTA
jgi:hypothetical protein